MAFSETDRDRIIASIGPAKVDVEEQSIANPIRVPDREPVVYFVKSVATGLVKIGFSADLHRRMKSLQTGSAEILELIAVMPGSPCDEKSLHSRFAKLRRHHEWFATDELMEALINELRFEQPIL